MDNIKWFSVKDALPEPGRVVLVGSPEWDYGVVANYAGKGIWIDTWHQRVTPAPTHWMQLPKPPGSQDEQVEQITKPLYDWTPKEIRDECRKHKDNCKGCPFLVEHTNDSFAIIDDLYMCSVDYLFDWITESSYPAEWSLET